MLVNPQYFREDALHYIKHGFYNDAPKGSKEYVQFWKERKRRCVEGYEVGGTKVNGKNYFYLNFFPIMREPSTEDKLYNKISSLQKKVLSFADFWEIQYDWHNAKEEAWNRPFGTGNHIVCLKTRGCGWSYMDAAEGVYNYNFIPGSKSFYLAFLESYLLGDDGVLLKCWEGLDHLNLNTNGYWKKNRQGANSDTALIKKAVYIDGEGNKKGYKSSISGKVIDNPRKVRGSRGIKVTLEEFGSFKNGMGALEALRPLVEEGDSCLGQISAFGTGGEEGEYLEALEMLFEDPRTHNFAEFENKWGDEAFGDKIGYFVPAYLGTPGFFDDKGKSKEVECKKFWNEQFDIKKSNSKALDKVKAERPFTPSDALRRIKSTIFNVTALKDQIKRIKLSRDIQGLIQHGVLVPSKDGIQFVPSADVKPLDHYPHKNEDDLTGCVTIYERPIKNHEGKIPSDLYLLLVDPFYKEDAEDRTSLGAVYVIKRDSDVSGTQGDTIVATYIARPDSLNTFHKNLFLLCDFYNGTIQSEISGGGQSIVDYARNKRRLDKLEYEPEMLHNKELASKSANKSYFMNMSADRKKLGITYLADWLDEPIGMDENGNIIHRYQRIYDVGFLTECTKFHPEKGNFDRVSCMLLGMYMLKEKAAIQVKYRKSKSSFFNRPLFTDGLQGSNNIPRELLP